MPDMTAVFDLCARLDRGEIDRHRFMEELARTMVGIVGCSRCAVRLLVELESGPALRTIALHDAATGRQRQVPDMLSPDPSPYFESLQRDGTVVAPDVSRSPAAAPFRASYLDPQGVRSLLDVGFSVNGVLYGTFSCEQLGAPVAWTQSQFSLMRQLSARASLTVMHALNAEIDTAPGALWEPSTPNRLMTQPAPLDPFPGAAPDDGDPNPGRSRG